MDIFRFIPSRDIHGHLKRIGCDATLKEKFAVWQEIIVAMLDVASAKSVSL